MGVFWLVLVVFGGERDWVVLVLVLVMVLIVVLSIVLGC